MDNQALSTLVMPSARLAPAADYFAPGPSFSARSLRPFVCGFRGNRSRYQLTQNRKAQACSLLPRPVRAKERRRRVELTMGAAS